MIMSYQVNPLLLEVSTNFLYKSMKNGLSNRGSTLIDLEHNPVMKKKIVSKTEAQIQRLYKKLYKQNKGDLEKTNEQWNSIWTRLRDDAHPYIDYKDPIISRQIAKERKARYLQNIIDPVADIERKYGK